MESSGVEGPLGWRSAWPSYETWATSQGSGEADSAIAGPEQVI